MFNTNISWKDIYISLASLIIAGGISIFLKNIFYNFQKPNGEKGGFVSFYTTIVFSIVTIVALITKDWFITLLTLIIAYLLARSRIDDNLNYNYQILLGFIIGVSVPLSIFYLINKTNTNTITNTILNNNDNNDINRINYEDKPEKAVDNRSEADDFIDEFRIE